MITITNERGEEIELPPGGITIKELVSSFGNCRVNVVTGVVAADQQTASGQSSDELNGLIPEPAVDSYTLSLKAGKSATVTTLSARLDAGTAAVRLRVAGVASPALAVDSTLKSIDIALALPAGQELSLEVTAQTGADNLAFTVALVG